MQCELRSRYMVFHQTIAPDDVDRSYDNKLRNKLQSWNTIHSREASSKYKIRLFMRHLSLAKIEAICTGHARSSRQNKQEATLSLRVFHNFGRSSLWKIEVCLLKKVSRKSSTGRNSCPHALVVEENRITFVSGKKDISRCKIFWIKNKSNSNTENKAT